MRNCTVFGNASSKTNRQRWGRYWVDSVLMDVIIVLRMLMSKERGIGANQETKILVFERKVSKMKKSRKKDNKWNKKEKSKRMKIIKEERPKKKKNE